MFKSSEVHLENTLQIEKSRNNERASPSFTRSRSAKLSQELQADAEMNHKKVVSELLFLQVGRREPLPYRLQANIQPESLPTQAARSHLSADDESDGYTVLAQPELPSQQPRVEVVVAVEQYEPLLGDSQKSKSAFLMLRTQCNSDAADSFTKGYEQTSFGGHAETSCLFENNPASDDGLQCRSKVQAPGQNKGLVPVTVVTQTASSHMGFFMFPTY